VPICSLPPLVWSTIGLTESKSLGSPKDTVGFAICQPTYIKENGLGTAGKSIVPG